MAVQTEGIIMLLHKHILQICDSNLKAEFQELLSLIKGS